MNSPDGKRAFDCATAAEMSSAVTPRDCAAAIDDDVDLPLRASVRRRARDSLDPLEQRLDVVHPVVVELWAPSVRRRRRSPGARERSSGRTGGRTAESHRGILGTAAIANCTCCCTSVCALLRSVPVVRFRRVGRRAWGARWLHSRGSDAMSARRTQDALPGLSLRVHDRIRAHQGVGTAPSAPTLRKPPRLCREPTVHGPMSPITAPRGGATSLRDHVEAQRPRSRRGDEVTAGRSPEAASPADAVQRWSAGAA